MSLQTKPMFEPLESRQLMSAGASLNAGVLRIDGTESADKVLVQDFNRTVRIGKNSVVLHRVQVTVTDPSGTVRTDDAGNPVQRSFDRDFINRIDVFAGAEDDHADLSGTALPSRIFLGAGDDTGIGASGDDVIYGQTGNDELWGRAGADRLYGGANDDRLFGQGGIDELYGNDGDDWLDAGSASQVAEGGAGLDFNAYKWSIGGTDRADVDQGRAHTCSLMSTLAAASYQGVDLTNKITYHGDYDYSVKMYNTAINDWVNIHVHFDGTILKNDEGRNIDPDLPTTGSAGTTEFWTVLYQRAYLSYFKGKDINDVDSVMSFTGDPDCAKTMKNVTGRDTSTESMPWFAEDLKWKLDDGKIVNAGGTGHRYAVLEVFKNGDNEWMVKLFNPRAYDGTHNDMPIEAVGSSDGVFNMTWSNFTNSEYFQNYTFSRT